MKKLLIVSTLAAALSGCVVAPYRPAPVVYEPVAVYPTYSDAYVWDATIGAFFFFDAYNHRHYMPRGWRYRR